MSYLINNQQKVNDIIFANRNKNYGAYAIRSSYGFTVLKSLGLMLLGFSSVISILWYFSNTGVLVDLHPPDYFYDTTIYSMTPPPDIDKPRDDDGASRKPDPAEAAVTTSITDVDSLPPEPPATLTMAVAGANTTGTTDGLPEPGAGTGAGSLTSISNGTSTTTFTAPVEPYLVDSMPEFDGGVSALKAYIARNLRYPEPARELGEQGIVYVKFVVDEKGYVGSIYVEKRAGYGMDEEATRVISTIPRFKKPAKAKGHPVKTYYQLPIKFVMK
jgi:protein TonB